MISLRELQWRGGAFRPALWRRLLQLLAQITILHRRGGFRRQTPDGVILWQEGGGDGGSTVTHAWQMALDPGTDGASLVSFTQRGLINGVEPTIDGAPMAQADPDSGEPPALTVAPGSFNAEGLCSIYCRIHIAPDWSVQSVEIVASGDPPAAAAWLDHKLIGFLVKDAAGAISASQHAHDDWTWLATERRAAGFAVYLLGAGR